jgi:aromatic-L-amino-acid decarboxylase
MLSAALGCIGFTWIASPACTELEMVMMDWLGKMMALPEEFLFSSGGKGGGVIVGTASEATLVTMLAAKSKTLSGLPGHPSTRDDDSSKGRMLQRLDSTTTDQPSGKLVAYASSQAHSSVERASLLSGVIMRLLPPDADLSLRGEILEAAILQDRRKGLLPFFVCATLGTTSTCAFDNLSEIGLIARKYNLWLHIDAAYAGSSFICPEYRAFLRGVEYADSVDTNPHKWLLVNFDCSTLWIRDASYLVDSFNVNPVYLRHEMQGRVPDYRHWQIPLGRRFRSLKMWFVFRSYGIRGLQAYIRKHCRLAKYFGQLLASDIRFEIPFPVRLGLVCFRLKNQSNEVNERLNQLINDSKVIHVTPSRVNDLFILRFAVCAKSTEKHDIDFAWREIREQADRVLRSSP